MEKELMETPSIDELSKGIALVLLAEWVAINDGKTRLESNEYMEEAQTLADFLHAIGYRLEKGTPKELMDCLLSPQERADILEEFWNKTKSENKTSFQVIAEAQLQSPKLKAYIDGLVQAERERALKPKGEKQGIYHTCPFCKEDGFDLAGLKCHLNNNCEAYQMTEEWELHFQDREEKE